MGKVIVCDWLAAFQSSEIWKKKVAREWSYISSVGVVRRHPRYHSLSVDQQLFSGSFWINQFIYIYASKKRCSKCYHAGSEARVSSLPHCLHRGACDRIRVACDVCVWCVIECVRCVASDGKRVACDCSSVIFYEVSETQKQSKAINKEDTNNMTHKTAHSAYQYIYGNKLVRFHRNYI